MLAGRYVLVDILGEGGTGAVWRAWDHRDHRYLAAKVLQQFNAGSLLRFVREQSFRIDHPHVITPIGWAGEDEKVLFTMELVRGGSVASLLRRTKPLPPQWVAVLLDQLLAGLDAVHQAGLVHRDVKPANLLLEPTGKARPHVLLSDFGIAVPLDEPRITRASQVLGTPGYLAPEQLTGADPAPRQDLYSAGVVAVELLTGTRPDPDVGVSTQRPDGAPPALWEYLRRLAASSPDERPVSCAQAREELAATGLLPPPDAVPEDPTGRVKIPDVLPPLPPGWGPHGPAPDDFVRMYAGDTSVTPDGAPDQPAPPDLPTAPRRNPEQAATPSRPVTPTRVATGSARVPGSPATDPSTHHVGPKPPGRGRRILVAAVALVTLGGAAVAARAAFDLLGEQGPTPRQPSPPPQNATAQPRTTDPQATQPQTTPGSTAPTASPEPKPGQKIEVGSPCSFTDVSQFEHTADGTRVQCRQGADDTYRWMEAD